VYSVLNQKAQENLIIAFAQYSHTPSPDQLNAVLAIQNTLTLMLSGMATPKYYLSSLDPGMGKTTAILAWLGALLERREAYDNQGVMIALDRLDEIERYIDDGRIPQDCYSVLVGEGEALNDRGLGVNGRNNALILYTTKSQIRKRCQSRNFNDVMAFHYNGQPRKVKIWDESFSIGKEIILNPYDFGRLFTPLNNVSSVLSDAVRQVVDEIIGRKNGDTYLMPELPSFSDDLQHEVIWESSKDKELAELLWTLSGQLVSIRMNKNRQVVVDCVPSIPDDFAPCLILDASARLKATYALQADKRNDIVRLRESKKSYRNLEVQVWAKASGKQILKHMGTVLPEVIALITDRPTEQFLIILHKDHKEPVSKALSKQLTTAEQEQMSYCTWGRHTATNEFSDIANIIMLSPYQFPDYAYEATTRAATVMTTANGKPDKEHVSSVKRGEILSNILQAVNRGKVRKSEGDTCPPCRLWLITHPNTGIATDLPIIFPWCTVKPWKLKTVHLATKKQRSTFAHIQVLIKQGVSLVLAATVRDHLEIKGSANNYTRDVLKQTAFVDALASIGWRCMKIGRDYVFRDQKMVEAI